MKSLGSKWGIGIFSICFVLIVSFVGCTSKGGTETGSTTSTPTDVSGYSASIESVASVLIPDMNPSEDSANVGITESISYASSEDWDYYAETSKSLMLFYIFGDADQDPQAETKIRYAVRDFATWVDIIEAADPNFECAGSSVLNEGDVLEVPFFGEIENGSSEYDCIYESEDYSPGSTLKVLFGTVEPPEEFLPESSTEEIPHVLHFVVMRENEDEVDENASVFVHGSANRSNQVFMASYFVNRADDGGNAYLDLQYVKLLRYNGDDGEFLTEDDFIYKMRSRVTGIAQLDGNGEPLIGFGDFTVTKYDENLETEQLQYTMAVGRGSYDVGDYSIFKMDTSSNPDYDGSQVFCLESNTEGIPAYADYENCTGYEDTYAWTDAEFPFDILPSIEGVFEDKPYFELGDTDLIANDGSNFTIPEYDKL